MRYFIIGLLISVLFIEEYRLNPAFTEIVDEGRTYVEAQIDEL